MKGQADDGKTEKLRKNIRTGSPTCLGENAQEPNTGPSGKKRKDGKNSLYKRKGKGGSTSGREYMVARWTRSSSGERKG